MEIFLEYTETAFCLQFIFYEIEDFCWDKSRRSPPLAMGNWSMSLCSAAEAVVSSSARPRGRNLQETLIIQLSCFAWLTSLRLYILPAVWPVVLHSSRTPIHPPGPRLAISWTHSWECTGGTGTVTRLPASWEGTRGANGEHHDRGTKQCHQPTAAVLEERPVSGIFQYLSCEAIILAPLGAFH